MPHKKENTEKKAERSLHFISKKVGRAVGDYKMIKDGDKIIVAVSGGKDSMTLLKLLKFRQGFAPVEFKLLAVYVDFGYSRTAAKSIAKFCKQLGVDCHIEKVSALKDVNRKDISCFWCSWNRRRALFALAGKKKFNKIALGHHMDDIIETVLLNLFYQGNISAMKPAQELFSGRITLIRPLAYIEEKEIARFARQADDFPCQTCDCPSAVDSKRVTVEKIIKQVSRAYPQVKKNIFQSVQKIKKDYLL